MDPPCELCGVERAVVYCKSDSARLCLQCDGRVHRANSLSLRHSRSLICDKCRSQPAIIRCMDEEMCMCDGCDWNGNGCIATGHRLRKLNTYNGCPSPLEFIRVLTLVLEMPICIDDTNFDNSFGTSPCSLFMSINEDSSLETKRNEGPLVANKLNELPCSLLSINEDSTLETKRNEGSLVANKLNELASNIKFEPSWAIPSNPNYLISCNRDPAPFLEGSGLSKQDCPIKDLGFQEGDLSKGVDFDDVTFNFDCGYELLAGPRQNHPRYSSEDKDLDCLVMEKNSSVTGSNSHVESSIETTLSSGQQEYIGLQSSQMAAATSSMSLLQTMSATANCLLLNPTSCNRSIAGLPFLPAPIQSSMSLSLSNITGESSATTDYQDCGLSPVFLNGESPWDFNVENSPQKRHIAKMRYNEKKKSRTFGKQIRYASRKARADTRRRVKGRFVKAGEVYDYDPSETKDF